MVFAVVKEHEMQIGSPTDVKHVAHIGWDGLTGNASPSWMNDIRASSELLSLGNFAPSAGTSWASQGMARITCSSEWKIFCVGAIASYDCGFFGKGFGLSYEWHVWISMQTWQVTLV
jgi:hypothetical protein